MATTPYSRDVKLAEWKEPIPLDLLYKGAIQKEGNIQQGLTRINNQLDQFANLPTLPGADSEIKTKLLDDMKQKISQIALSDLSSPAAQSQINSYISSVTNNPDLQNVVRRGMDYQQANKKYKELTEKGEYIAPWNMQKINKYNDYINNYSTQGKYLRDFDFSGDIYKSPDINKEISDLTKLVGEQYNIDINKLGHDIVYKEKNADKLYQGIMSMMSPEAKAEFRRKFDYNFGNQDLYPLRATEFQKDYDTASNLSQEYASIGDTKNAEYWANQARNARAAIESETPQSAREFYVNKHFKEYIQKVADAAAYKEIQQFQQNHAYNAATDLYYKKQEIDYRNSNKLQTIQNQALKSFYSRYYTVTGQMPVDENGNFIPVQELPDIPSLTDLKQKAQSAQKKEKGEKTLDNVLSDLEYGITTTNDQQVLESLIKNRKIELGLSPSATPENIKFEDGKVKFTDTNGWNKDYEFTPSELKAKLKGESTPTTFGLEIREDALNAYAQQYYEGDVNKLTKKDLDYLKTKFPK